MLRSTPSHIWCKLKLPIFLLRVELLTRMYIDSLIVWQCHYQIIGKEDHDIDRTIKESIYIRVNNSTLNRNIGNFKLSYIWDRILLSTPGPEIKSMHKILGMPSPHNLTPPCTFYRFYEACTENTLE